MPEIRTNPDCVTQITVADAEDGEQDHLLEIMKERARYMATQPGFISVSLHRSLNGKRIVNYVQWASREQLTAAHHSPEFRERWPEVGEAAEGIGPSLYQVVHIED